MREESVVIPSINRTIVFKIGKNAKDNHDIIDEASGDDMWFHVDERTSCHIIASIPEDITRKEMKYIIKQGAVLCKKYSYPNIKKLGINYARIKNVTKTEVPGEVIVKEESKIVI